MVDAAHVALLIVTTEAVGFGPLRDGRHRADREDNRQFPDGLTLTLTDLPARLRREAPGAA